MSTRNVTFEKYSALEKHLGISPMSPEAHYAEVAWNEAVRRVAQLFIATRSLPDADLTMACELENLNTGYTE